MEVRTEKKGSLQERLSAIRKRLDRIDTADSRPEVVDYERVGDRVSVKIRPRSNTNAA